MAGTSSCMTARLSLRMQKRDSYGIDFSKISFLEFLGKFVDIIPFSAETRKVTDISFETNVHL
jgi:hypothetical protein